MNLSNFVSENPNPVWRMDETKTVLYKNEAFRNVLIEAGLQEKDLTKIFPNNFSTLIGEALKTAKPVYDLEITIGDKVFSCTMAPVVENRYVNIYAVNITQNKKAEKYLIESEKKYRALFEGSIDGILISNTESKKFKYANPSICNMLQYSENEMKEMGVMDIHPKEALECVQSKLESQIKGEMTLAENIPCLKRDGTIIYTDVNASIIIIEGKEYLVGFFRDITDRMQANEEKEKLQNQLQQSNKMEAIVQLAGGVAHDFNNLLGAITGYSDVLKIKMDDNSDLVKYVHKIQDAALKASNLTRQLLTFARKAQVSMETVDIHNAIDQMLGILERTIDCRIEIKRHFCAQKSTIIGDSNLIENALLNLAINARDAMPDGGCLTLATEVTYLKQSWFGEQMYTGMPGTYLKVSITDTGIGMDKATQAKVFEPFFTTKELGKGTGLGLASVFGCIKQHNGYITVESEPGKGSQITLFLPHSDKAVKEAKDEMELIHGEGTVLVVDDEIRMRESVSDMLTGLGYKVVSCTNGFEAVEYFRMNYKETDVVLLDMIMPKMNGIDCYQKLKDINPQVRVILASGYSDEKQDIQIKELGVKDFIEKPFNMCKLSHCISNLLVRGSK